MSYSVLASVDPDRNIKILNIWRRSIEFHNGMGEIFAQDPILSEKYFVSILRQTKPKLLDECWYFHRYIWLEFPIFQKILWKKHDGKKANEQNI